MKKFIYFIGSLVILIVLASCNEQESNTFLPTENLQSLRKVINYSPYMANFTSKRVQNYLNNKIVNDTTYNALGSYTERRDYFYTPTLNSIFKYDATNTLIGKSQGKIIKIEYLNGSNQINSKVLITYDANNIYYSTVNSQGVSTLTFNLKTNSDGFIYYQSSYLSNDIKTLQYLNDKPIAFENNGLDTTYYDYYTNSKPSNLLKSTVEINNEVLTNSSPIEHAYRLNNHYQKNHGTYLFYDTDFNSNNYINYIKYTSEIVGLNSESFYFYN